MTTDPNACRSILSRGTWLVLVLNALLLTVGCSPANLAMLISSFSDNKMPPEYKITTNKEVIVAVMANCSLSQDMPEEAPIDAEMAEAVAQHMKLRCKANKEKLKIVPLAQVRNYQHKLGQANASPLEIGKHFNADYVLDLEINSLELYEKRSHRQFYRGNSDVEISLYDLHKPDGEYKVFTKPFRCEFPSSGPRDVGDCSSSQFRTQYMAKIGREVSKLFIPYPADERIEME
jgi:hypothetical protein